MDDVQLVKPTLDMVESIAADMRQADAAEVWASHGHTPIQAVMAGWKLSQYSVVVMVNDEPCVIMGLVSRDLLSGIGTPWLLGTEKALNHAREFFRLSPPVINDMLKVCPRLFNYVHADNKVSIKWLKWIGFIIDEPIPHGINGELFHRFHLERSV